MELNLKIQPLSSVENLFLQKCLLPKSKFPLELRPGAWCKCFIGETFSLCQVFPRENLTSSCCYLDDTVASRTKVECEVLTKLEVCEITKISVPKEVTLTFFVTEKLFENKNIEKISLEYLSHIAKYYLQALHLMVATRVQLTDLEQLGIVAICIDNATADEESNIFTIDDETKLKINDVQLLNATTPSNFYKFGFEQAQHDLNDLLQVAEIQRNSSWQLRPSLNALLVGATGCGKSALAQWFIQENHCNCFRLTASNVLGDYPGETEATLRRKFLALKNFVKQLRPRCNIIFESLVYS